jgi:hypothetical protein
MSTHQTRDDRLRRRRLGQDGDQVLIDVPRHVDVLEIVNQSVIEAFRPVKIRLNPVVLGQPLTQQKRLGIPFFDDGRQVIDLGFDRLPAAFQRFDTLGPVTGDQRLLLGDFVVHLEFADV